MKAEFAEVIATLARGNVEFILIGGLAATLHGSARFTRPPAKVKPRRVGRLLPKPPPQGAAEGTTAAGEG